MVLPIHKPFGVVDAKVVKVSDVERVIGSIAIGINNAVRLYFASNDGNQGVRFGVLHGNGVDAPTSLQETRRFSRL